MNTAVEWLVEQLELDVFATDEEMATIIKAKETQKLTMINALVEFSIEHFDIHTEEAILNITRRAEKYYNETIKQQEQ
jgi:hypothetical protein